ncbi:MAG: F0F1 ATP synthase subunit alpha [Nitrospirae bacterium]|nr:F0F1 ATP synthase subunit alpha [Nitrospirota bacterium]MDE3041241.1 F0F1 ATP synthase subunit alpha [Nitrospirota bacterium]MDE3219573.1 F0F1 ATP synthase subunit alpha [Nitrospirota bacterium]
MPLNSLLATQAAWLEGYRLELRILEQGRVRSVGDGIVWIEGLPSAGIEEILSLEDGSRALVFDLSKERLGGILLTQTAQLTAGTVAHLSGQRLSLPVGDALVGRVINPLGDPLDGHPPPDCPSRREMFVSSPPIVARDFVHRPLYTGSKVVDTLIPIAKGQRQLVIGDNGVGKRAFALDAVINQRGKDVRCVYVLIGQKRSSIVNTIETLRAYGAMDYTTIVAAEATALPGLKYLAPFAGCAVAEEWMWQGKDTLVIYDDLTTHAQTYRELSLLLRRPPGREAYPGDIFFLHSRLLERSTCLAPKLGGGSMTALPIVETTQGEIASYIPTNLISITDGQIYFDTRFFAAGVVPAIDVTKSVSRIGGKGQHPRIKEQAGRMKLDYLQFLELEVFTRFGARLETSMEAKIKRGRVLREILKQDRLSPLPIEFQLAWLMGYNRGLFDDVLPGNIGQLLQWVATKLSASQLTLDSRDDQWAEAVTSWLKEGPSK